MGLHAVGDCPQLRSLRNSVQHATAAHLGQYMMLQSLSILGPGWFPPDPIQFSFVEGLTPLTRVQHLHLTQCVPLKQFCHGLPW